MSPPILLQYAIIANTTFRLSETSFNSRFTRTELETKSIVTITSVKKKLGDHLSPDAE